MTDVLIIGAGPSGAMAAALLVQRGFKVLVLEKQNFPRFSIGESLVAQSLSLICKGGNYCSSSTRTLKPRCTSRAAAIPPEGPAPIISTSVISYVFPWRTWSLPEPPEPEQPPPPG